MLNLDIVKWPDDVAGAYRAAGLWRGGNLADAVDDHAATRPDAVAVRGPDTDLTHVDLTYGDLVDHARTTGANLVAAGLRAGDRVLVQVANTWRFVPLLLACLRRGVVPVMCLTGHRERELTHLADLTRARAILVTADVRGVDHLALARRVVAGSCLEQALDIDDVVPRAGSSARAVTEGGAGHGPGGEDPAVLLLSGGTGGLPKAICRTHDDYGYNARTAAGVCGVSRSTVYLAVLPLGHNFPLACPGILGVLGAGGTVVVSPSPRPEVCFELVRRYGVTMTALVPTVAQRWLDHVGQDPASRGDLDSLRLLQVGGSRLADSVARRIGPELGCALQQVFGMAEGLINMTRLDDPDDVVTRTQGRPMSGHDELRILDEDGAAVADGAPGLLLTRGPYTPRGYVNAAAYNREAFTPDGWFRTGDVVRRRRDGNLVVEGRDKDIINRGGEKISAEDVEDLAYRCPAVLHAAAVAVPDASLGERVCLAVVPREGRTVTLEDIHTEMRAAGAARTKYPDKLHVVDAFPLTGVGKIDKKALRLRFAPTREEERSTP
ncbi:(2,3-dihydroxybenzoyl)adenylate synthase [Myceligenerans indicum]|uniref:(2,3-dihydroxybenzoyl)adenylate synthase n=1 Tax=Myceligenerans indicum TaxID=2593663 RepID=A0ABS1LHA7_9MICO|nr:AMP-binding protein [Myceligenerans indicum]MBL0885615.1 (2,3-dihydroxybenzoyl)adenylate synthase [Myceligenerans indicum]